MQHADNPVDWYPWGPEALARSRVEDRPILLSIGYAACHWCHVMAHESFEDQDTADLMNELFVNIKVDREERPDLDGIYMQAVQAMTGHGGWPMTVFLTPDGAPYYGGTYFPPSDRPGMPSFQRVLRAVADAYRNRKAQVAQSAATMRQLYGAMGEPAISTGDLTLALLERAYRGIAQRFDVRNGGFEGAPKFPPTMAMDFLMRYWGRTGNPDVLSMVTSTFRAMSRGGIYDQIGGGFARYAVDAIWLVPHFEKMLYDNAQLIRLGAHLFQATGDADVRRVTEETVDWAVREMLDDAGGFYSSLDADSEGHEGKFYVWTPAQLDTALGQDAEPVKAYYGVTEEGNFEDRNILFVAMEPAGVAARHGMTEDAVRAAIARGKRALYASRATREWPGRDEKVVAAWNGLMVAGVAEAARVFGRDDYRDVAIRCGEFLFSAMLRDRRVLRAWKSGVANVPGFLEDHAALGLAAIALYELTFEPVWVERADLMGRAVVDRFWDDATGAFFDTASDAESLITRPRDATDNATPSGTSLAVDLLLRLADLTGDSARADRARHVLQTLAEPMARYPQAFGHLLGAADMAIHGAVEVALAGRPSSEGLEALRAAAAQVYVPSLVLAGGDPASQPTVALLRDRAPRDGRATAYVCHQYVCDAPVIDPAELRSQLGRASRAR